MTGRSTLLAALPLAALLILGGTGWRAAPKETTAPQIPDDFANLQVLPDSTTKQQLVDTMKGIAQGLGVRCSFCHEGEGRDLSTYDFASDAKPHKATARVMLRMVRDINEKHLANLDPNETMGQTVKCITCHQGQERPPEQ